MSFEPSGFFVLRAPLLSIEAWQRWGDDGDLEGQRVGCHRPAKAFAGLGNCGELRVPLAHRSQDRAERSHVDHEQGGGRVVGGHWR